jgi:hypothetical protein
VTTETDPTPDTAPEPFVPALPIKGGPKRKPGAPRTEQQQALAATLAIAETRLDQAARAFLEDRSVAVELEFHLARMGVSSAWAGYLRATGDHTGALKYGEEEARFARVAVGLREVLALDLLDGKKKPKTGQAAAALGKRPGKTP